MKQYLKGLIRTTALMIIFYLPFSGKAQPEFGNCPTCVPAVPQNPTTSAIGVEYKYHPGVNIIGARYDAFKNRNNWNVGIAFNISSKNKTSKEKGVGILVGYRYAIQSSSSGIFFGGIRTAIWFNKTDAESSDKESSKTLKKDVLLQPGLEAGYQLVFNTHNYVTPAISYDYGFRLKSDDENKSMNEKGKIFLGLSAGYKF